MRHKLLLILLLVAFSAFSQQQKITVNFQQAELSEAFQRIETLSGYRFYYDPAWIAGAPKVTANFTDADPKAVLEILFRDTDLNFIIDENRVVLTLNNSIYEDLPQNYFGNGDPAKSLVTAKPYFHRESSASEGEQTDDEVVLVGKDQQTDQDAAATLNGYIRDSKTGAGIAGLLITLDGSDASAETDEKGFYSLPVKNGRNTVTIRGLNYLERKRSLMVYGSGKLDVRLEENPNMLREVIVNSAARKNMKTTVMGVTTIDVEKIKTIPLILGERDIFRVAAALPGIKNVGEGASGYSVRGGKEDQNLILLDDAVLYNPSHFLGFFSAVNPFTTATANIYKGSIPAEFGGRLSSVFDIKSKKADTGKITGEGGIGPITSNLSVSLPIVKGKSGLIVGGRATYSDWILKSLDEESLKDSKASFYDFIAKYNHKISEKDQVEVMGYYSKDAFSITSDSLYRYSNRLFSAKWEHTFNDKNRGALSVTNSEYRFNIDYEGETVNDFDLGYKIVETQANIRMNYKFNERHNINYGLAGKMYGIDPGYLHPKDATSLLEPVEVQKEKAFESAVYVADNFEVSEKFQLNVGLRYSWYAALGESTVRTYQPGVPLNEGTVTGQKEYGSNEIIKSYGGFEPRISARYSITPDFSVKAGFDQTYQYLHLLSNNTTQAPTDTWKLSDGNVRPQRSQQFSAGLYQNLKNDEYEVSLEGYYKRSENILDYKVGAQLLLNEFVETQLLQGQGKSYGLEFLLKKQTGRLNGWIGYTYSRALLKLDSKFTDEIVNNGDYFAANYDKPHDFSAVLNYKLTQRFSLSGNFVYQTGRPITYPIGSYVYNGIEYTLYSDRNKFRIPDYYRLDLGLNIEGSHKIKKLAHSFWNISVYNVLGRNNPYSVFFISQNGEIKAYKTSIFSIPVPTVTYNFKF